MRTTDYKDEEVDALYDRIQLTAR